MSKGRGIRKAMLTAVIVFGFVAGCTSAPSESESAILPVSSNAATVSIATVDPGSPGVGDAVGVVGTLVVEGGCLYVQEDGTRYLPVFPASVTSWDGALQFEGSVFHVGDTVEISGSEYQGDIPAGVAIPAACDTSHVRDANYVRAR